jgi:non-homologous end joining protein Ku
MNHRRAVGGLLAAGALACSLTACGSSSSDTLSRSQIDAKANVICRVELTQGNAVKAPANIQDATAAAAYFDKIEPIVDAATTKLQALKPDDTVRAQWSAYIKARLASSSLLKTVRRKADAKDASGLTDLQRAPALQKTVHAAATAVGATACAQ